MTTLIKQLSGNDCVLASIAMARGAASWHDVWTDDDLQAVIKSQGVSDYRPWLLKAGFKEGQFKTCDYLDSGGWNQGLVRGMLWRRPALLSVHSLNNDNGHHMVFWDGREVFDPSTQRTYLWLHSMTITRVVLFDDAATAEIPS